MHVLICELADVHLSICTLNSRWKWESQKKGRNNWLLKRAATPLSVPVKFYWIRPSNIFSLHHQPWEYAAWITVNTLCADMLNVRRARAHSHTYWGSLTAPGYSKHPVSSFSPSLHQMLWCASVLGQKSPSAKRSAGPAAPWFQAVRLACVEDKKSREIMLREEEGEGWARGWFEEERKKIVQLSLMV